MKNVVSEKCLTCNAPLKYNSKEDLFICEYCGNKYTLNDLKKARKPKLKESSKKKMKIDSYTCENCGAVIILGENTSSTSCVYCKSSAIIKNRLEDLYEPSRIITFKFNKEDAINKYKELLKGRILIPDMFKDTNNIQDMEGLYVPFWLYNCNNQNSLYATCTKTSSWSDSKYLYTKTDYYKVTRFGKLKFNNVPNDAATRFDDKIMNSIEPFNYDEFKEFDKSYLAGYISEKYDVDSEEAFKNVTDRIDSDSKQYLLDDMKFYSSKTVDNYESKIEKFNHDYVLLPVWVLNIKYNDKIYRFSMNGQTGKFVGEIPVDKKKLIILILLSFFIPFIIIFLIGVLV